MLKLTSFYYTFQGYIKQGKKNFIIIPIAFVNEHIETLHELDIEYCHELAEEVNHTILLINRTKLSKSRLSALGGRRADPAGSRTKRSSAVHQCNDGFGSPAPDERHQCQSQVPDALSAMRESAVLGEQVVVSHVLREKGVAVWNGGEVGVCGG